MFELFLVTLLPMTGRGFLTPLPPLSNTVPRNRPFLQRRTQAPSYGTSTTDDLADYSGSALSGAWNLEYDFEGTKVPSRMVSLLPSGKFSSPPPGSGSSIPDSAPRNTVEVLDGAWSVDPDSQEFTVAIYGVAKNVKIWFVGSIDATGSAISGAVGEVKIRTVHPRRCEISCWSGLVRFSISPARNSLLFRISSSFRRARRIRTGSASSH